MAIHVYRCQTASQVSLFVGFLISWISLPTKTTTIGRQENTMSVPQKKGGIDMYDFV